MKKKRTYHGFNRPWTKLFLVMRLSIFLMLAFVLASQAKSFSQSGNLTMNLSQVKLVDVLNEIEEQTDYYFYFNLNLDQYRVEEINAKNQEVKEVLNSILPNLGLNYEIVDRYIVIKKGDNSEIIGVGQQKSIKGTIKDSSGMPLPGVTVVVKGTTNGTISNFDGVYELSNVPGNAIIQFSFVGMKTIEVAVAGKSTVDAVLQEDAIGIEEVVAIGYGTQKKVNLTGSVESIDGDQLSRQPVPQTSQALAGLAPGLTAIQSSGQPGKDSATLRIRGLGSIGASNDPLVLIDGVEGNINGVDANDIANISVLKDAASAAIYGSRASNGVILITTKRADKSKLSVNYRNYVGWQKIADQPEFVGASEFLKYSGSSEAEVNEYMANHAANPDLYPDTDWVNETFTENGFQQYHNLSVNGGTDKMGILASLSYTDQGANIKSYKYIRYNGRINTDIKFSDKFDINFDVSFRKSNVNEPSVNLNEIVRQTYRVPPIYTAIHSDGSWGDAWNGQNPIAYVTDGGYNNTFYNSFRGALTANFRPIENLTFSVKYAPEYNDGYNKHFTRMFQTIVDWNAKTTRDKPSRNSLSQSYNRSFTDNFNALVSYSKDFGNHRLSALGGYEFIKYEYEKFGASRTDFILQDYQVLNAGSEENDANSGTATQNSLVSYFARANYSYKDRYLLEANVRRDASSRFNKDNQVGVFPSFSAGWRLSEEEFIQDMDIFSNLKLRASWGQLGNQQIGSDFPYASSIALGSSNYILNDAVVTGASQNVLANTDIRWETTETMNIGVDAGVLDQKLTFSLEYYVRKTKDILLELPIPYVIGLEPSTQNAGNVENKGWDFTADWQDRIGEFKYKIGFNISDVQNEVTNLAGVGPIINGSSIIQVGSPINMIYGYETLGVFQDEASIAAAPAQFGSLQVGNLQYVDQLTVDTDGDGIADQADGIINPDDRVILGNPFPRLNYGLDIFAEYKGFDLAISLQGSGKRDVLIGGDLAWPLFNAGKIQQWQIDEFWTPENPDAKYPKILPTSAGSNDIQTSSTWVFDASYLRVRNVSLGYTLPKSILNKAFVKNLRVYVTGQNLLTFDSLPDGMDPLTPNGSSGGLYPITKSFIMGVDIKF